MEENEVITWFVITGVLLMLILALTVIFFVTQHREKYLMQQNEFLRVQNENEQALLKSVIATQESERTRIGINLHDSIGIELSALKMNLGTEFFVSKGKLDPDYFKSEMKNLEGTIENIRIACMDLYPKSLEVYGFISAHAGIVNRLGDVKAIDTKFICEMTEDELVLDFPTKLNLFRVCQEVLNNLIKYSQCNILSVNIFCDDDKQLKIIFQHNGVEFLNRDAETLMQKGTGIGLKSIKNRINLIQGKINYLRDRDNSIIEIFVPFKNDE